MPELSPETQSVLAELQPILLSLAKDTIASALRQMPSTHVELGTVKSIDQVRGIASVLLDSRSIEDSVPLEADIISIHPHANDRVWVEITPPHGPRVVGRSRGFPGLLGWGHRDAPAALSVGVTIVVELTAVVQANRLIRISCHAPPIDTPAGGAAWVAGWVGGSTFFGRVDRVPVGAGMNGEILFVPAFDGPVLFQFALATDAGTATAEASAAPSDPGSITMSIEDIGPAFG